MAEVMRFPLGCTQARLMEAATQLASLQEEGEGVLGRVYPFCVGRPEVLNFLSMDQGKQWQPNISADLKRFVLFRWSLFQGCATAVFRPPPNEDLEISASANCICSISIVESSPTTQSSR